MSFKVILSALAFFSIAFAVQAQEISEKLRLEVEIFQIDQMLEDVYYESEGVVPIGVVSYLSRKKHELEKQLEKVSGREMKPNCTAVQSKIEKLQTILREQGKSLGRWGRDQLQQEIDALQKRLDEMTAGSVC